jgi:hypothetical protein
MFTEPQLKELIADIKKKKELKDISDSFVKTEAVNLIHKNPKLLKQKYNQKSKGHKQLVKDVRAILRRVYGLFWWKPGDTLPTHSSTRERLSFYPELYSKIFKITGQPKIILDLACGLNPLSLPMMELKNVTYLAFDINQGEMNVLNQFFAKLNAKNKQLKGVARVMDISNTELISSLPEADVAFLFKATDVLDRGKGHKVSEEVLKAIPAKYVVISFATKTMSGKKMTAPGRRWVTWMCDRLKFKYKVIEFSNEIFYVVEKVI